jgi:iron complex transport system substrate-binding protein
MGRSLHLAPNKGMPLAARDPRQSGQEPREERRMPKHLSAAGARPAARILVVLVAVLVAACDTGPPDQGQPQASGQAAGFPVTLIESNGTTITLHSQPQRIVSLSPTATEMLFAIGAGPQVVAVDDQSNYPSNAPMTKLSGFQPNIEAIAGYHPDLVVATDDTGGLVHGMAALSVPTLLEPAAKTLDDSYAQIKQLGQATGHVSKAQTVASQMKQKIDQAIAPIGPLNPPLRIYHELDDTYYSATSATFIGAIYKLLGLENIADKAKGAATDYPQLSSEYIVSSDPNLIVLADTKCCHQDASTVAARPGWNKISAVRAGNVILVNDDVASRWGPRIVEFVFTLALRLKQIESSF